MCMFVRVRLTTTHQMETGCGGALFVATKYGIALSLTSIAVVQSGGTPLIPPLNISNTSVTLGSSPHLPT